jgi:hypothetical protein
MSEASVADLPRSCTNDTGIEGIDQDVASSRSATLWRRSDGPEFNVA